MRCFDKDALAAALDEAQQKEAGLKHAIEDLRSTLAEAERAREAAERTLKAMGQQCDLASNEVSRLSEENARLRRQLRTLTLTPQPEE